MVFYDSEALQEAYSRGFSNGFRSEVEEDFDLEQAIAV